MNAILFFRWLVRGTPRGLRLALLALGLVGLPGAASALSVCIGTCSCNTVVTNVVFAPYNPLQSSNDDSTGTVKVNCNALVALNVGYTISLSTGSSNSFATRQMTSGANKLAYNLYATSTPLGILGDATGGSVTLSGTIVLDLAGVGTPQTWTVYGRIPGGQNTVAPGNYTDTVLVTVTYN